jgi:hypothetical protein
VPVKKLAVTHTTPGRADDHQLRFSSFGGFTSFAQSQARHPSATVQALGDASGWKSTFQPFIGNLTSGLTSSFCDIKTANRPNAILPTQQRTKIGFRIRTKR